MRGLARTLLDEPPPIRVARKYRDLAHFECTDLLIGAEARTRIEAT